MQYLFFDTALNGVYSLSLLKNLMPSFLPLLADEENISEEIAPFIFQLKEDEQSLFNQIVEMDLKEIVFCNSDVTLTEIRNHFQKMTVQNIKGKPFYFRFWSGKVFKKYIASCDENQLNAFFGPVVSFVCADDLPGIFQHFNLAKGRLIIERSKRENTGGLPGTENAIPESPPVIDLNIILPKKKAPRKFF